ncbi:MFS transporter [Kyrpidia spormannii]|uniref:Metabolite transport protein HI_1104 n=1 Tax=Kyrpidia spormannii TaxID=2055160 RepID=A0ACA8Z9N9_9BACL|nr:MFS transporter [Kyrpidia spormannii]CAB3392772.1 putative metabolite transport protein HI_1104 [Kyrpidia spormannii]
MGVSSSGVQVPKAGMEPEQKDRVTPYHWKVLWSSAIGYAMDGLDLMILSMVLSAMISDLHLTTAQAGGIATVTLFGAVIGGIGFGILADAVGRVRTFTWSIVIFAVFTGLTAFATNLTWVNVFRFIAGLGLGGEFGIGMTLVTETWPARYRARATSGVALGFQVGVVLAILTSLWIQPLFGWRGVFFVGIIPALFAAWARRSLKEPDLWQQRTQGARSVPLSLLFNTPRAAASTVGLTILCSVQNFGYYGIMTWVPTMLAKQLGFSFNKSGVWTIVTVVGMMIGIVVFGWLADRWGRRPSFILFQLASAAAVWLYTHQTIPVALLIGGAIMGFFVNGMMAGYGALIAESYPTEVRSTAENVTFNVGRAIGGLAPFVIGYLALHQSLSSAIGVISGVYVVAALTTLLLIQERKGAELT